MNIVKDNINILLKEPNLIAQEGLYNFTEKISGVTLNIHEKEAVVATFFGESFKEVRIDGCPITKYLTKLVIDLSL